MGKSAATTTGYEMPDLLRGRCVELSGRRLFVREGGPSDAPVLVLLHGLGANADLNWFTAYPMLTARFRVIAPDLPGHGRSDVAVDRFVLADAATDIAELMRVLGVRRLVAVGYSMGGVVAQLLWRDHRELVDGLVLAATSRNFRGDPRERMLFALYPAASFFVRAASPEVAHAVGRLFGAPGARTRWREWIRREVARTSPRVTMQAACELAAFSSHDWASQIDVPTAVICSTRDKLIPARRQRRLADAIPGAVRFDVDGDHFACTERPDLFLPALDAACRFAVGDGFCDAGRQRPAA